MRKQCKRVVVREFGGTEKLLVEAFDPSAELSGNIEVAVSHAGINRADILLREGKYHLKELPITPGIEASGTVLRASHGFGAGDRVLIYRAQSGMYSERVKVSENDLIKLPSSLSLQDAASIPLNWLTAYDCVVRLIGAKGGQSIVIFAAASGVGQAAIQIAKGLGVKVYAIVSTEAKARFLRNRFGVASFSGIDPDVITRWVLEQTAAQGTDGVFDLVGGNLFRAALKITRPGGVVAQAANPSLEDSLMNVRDFYPRNITICGFQFGNLMAIKRDQFSEHLAKILTGFKEGIYQAHDLSVFTIDTVQAAHLKLQDRTHVGKILLRLGEDS